MWKQIWRDTILVLSRHLTHFTNFRRIIQQTHTPRANKLRGKLSAPQRPPLCAIPRVGREGKKAQGGASFCHNSLTIFLFLFLVLTRDTGHALKGEGGHSFVRAYHYFLFNLFNLIFFGARQFSGLYAYQA